MLSDDVIRAMLAAAPAAPQAEPVAIVRVHRTGGNAGIAWSAVPTGAQMMRDGDLLYAAPQPERQPVSEPTEAQIEGLAHEVWAAAQLIPGEGIVDGIDRIVKVLRAALAARE